MGVIGSDPCNAAGRIFSCGEVAEWSIAAVSKTVVPSRVPGVRISPSPPLASIGERDQEVSVRIVSGKPSPTCRGGRISAGIVSGTGCPEEAGMWAG
jgi:hypothetical protein